MPDPRIAEHQKCLNRILLELNLADTRSAKQKGFKQRLMEHFPRLFELLSQVYDNRYDLHFHLKELVKSLQTSFAERAKSLHNKDASRLADPGWYRSENMVGMACYVDLVASDLADLKSKIPYFAKLGITYLHLMPFYKSPEKENDGGYAVSDYRQVNPKLGDTEDLRSLANALDEAGISLVLDFVFNHTSDEHEWALAARTGDPVYENYYYIFPDRTEPDNYERTLREIFPQIRRGSFTHLEDIDKWVWTTFNSFQWDLNYANPEVFRAVVSEMLFLANIGCDVLRLDALAFIWKEMGTSCESQPKAHMLIQAFNACLSIAAPGVVFKSEAIVHPDEVVQFIHHQECQLSYNPLLMALLWNSLATRKTRLLQKSLNYRFNIPDNCSWVNYARCHDDIGWTFDDMDAASIGVNGYDHRLFLNKFFTGDFPGSFSTGMGFQFNPENGDCRVCGSLASLCGLEQAIRQNDKHLVKMAVARIKLMHSIILSIGGIPLLYQGDELAILNDYSFLKDEGKKHDSRWVNRPKITEEDKNKRLDRQHLASEVFDTISHMIQIRKSMPLLGAAKTCIPLVDHPHLFLYMRVLEQQKLYCLVNFSDKEQSIELHKTSISAGKYIDLLSDSELHLQVAMTLKPYAVLWLQQLHLRF